MKSRHLETWQITRSTGNSCIDKLQAIDLGLSRRSEMVSDTRMVAGAELYEFARVAYKMAKISASIGTPGTQSIVDDLGRLYANNGKSNPVNPVVAQ